MIHILASRSIFGQPEVARVLQHYIKKEHQILIIGFSFFGSFDLEKYNQEYGLNMPYDVKMKNMFLNYGIKEEQVNWIYYKQTKYTDALKLIENADIIYFPGGAPDLMMQRIKDENLLTPLKQFKGIVMGSSAGAMIQFDTYHISKDQDYFKYSLHTGLGYLDNFMIEVHYRRRKQQKSAMRKSFQTFNKDIYVIPDDGFLVIQNQIVYPYVSSKKYYQKGRGVI